MTKSSIHGEPAGQPVGSEVRSRAEAWTAAPFDEATQAAVRQLLANDPDGLHEAFYRDIDFGTGGMRGIMGVGTNRINRYTLGQASEGLARYVKAQVEGPWRIAIAHDTRHNSEALTAAVAGVFVAHGFEVFLFDGFTPTPLLSFAVRELDCHAGIVLTASHNPPAYNGYKVYWNDGAQVVPPQDRGIIEEVRKVRYDEIRFGAEGTGGAEDTGGAEAAGRITRIGEDLFQRYFEELRQVRIHPDLAEAHDLRMVFTPLHGTTVHLLPRALEATGFPRPQLVEAQAVPSGDFPTVKSPNPEEPEALAEAVKLAESLQADLVLGCDPDGDRIGIAVPLPPRMGADAGAGAGAGASAGAGGPSHQMVLLNGNQTASLMVDYLIRERVEAGTLPARAFICSTVVTSELLAHIAAHYGVKCYESLTGFKWIAEQIRLHEADEVFLGGGEESYGFMVGDFVRDKDGIGSAVLLAEAAARVRTTGGLYGQLLRLYEQFGYYHEQMHSLTLEGAAGAERIQAMMRGYRSDPPATLMGEQVVRVRDFDALEVLDVASGERESFAFAQSNVLQFFTEAGSRVTVRPSGTEPKIKFYVSLREEVAKGTQLTPSDLDAMESRGRSRVAACLKELGV